MNNVTGFACYFLLAAGMAASAAAQTDAIPGNPGVASGRRPPLRGVVVGAPYSGVKEIRAVKTLGDGTHMTFPIQKTVYYRDSEGRVRIEKTLVDMPGVGNPSSPFVSVQIADPVAGYRYDLDPGKRVAHRMPLGNGMPIDSYAAASGRDTQATAAERNGIPGYRPQISNESLGTKTIEGVAAEGSRTTTVWPVGSLGNDRAIANVAEVWTSRELGIDILVTLTDPRLNDTTVRMTNISREEPDPALFRPPDDYKLEEFKFGPRPAVAQ